MLKISEYEDRAVECRKMAFRTHDVTKKAQFEEIGRAWQMLADARMKQLERRLRSCLTARGPPKQKPQSNAGASHAWTNVRLPAGASLTPRIPARMNAEVKARNHLGGIRARKVMRASRHRH
jgi:hypothetical protein